MMVVAETVDAEVDWLLAGDDLCRVMWKDDKRVGGGVANESVSHRNHRTRCPLGSYVHSSLFSSGGSYFGAHNGAERN